MSKKRRSETSHNSLHAAPPPALAEPSRGIENIGATWPGCEGLFPIADNGAGDQFLVDLRQTDPEVIYYLHETAERKGLGVTLSSFLAAPRRPVPDE